MKTKLWDKGVGQNTAISELIASFTVGNDTIFDLDLAPYDIQGTKAHAAMLESIGLLTKEENGNIQSELDQMYTQIMQGNFEIENGVEDIHSQIEINLTKVLGEAGKKVHAGRSRNDQVLLALKLYLKDTLKSIAEDTKQLFDLLIQLSEKHQNDLLPGYTHFQIAMPSSFGLWFAAYAESLTDDLEFLHAAYNVCDKNPLGSAAGYGSSFPLNRSFTTKELGMKSMNINPVYAQMTRGKAEKTTAIALSAIGATLSKLAYDVCLYMNQDFGFISFPSELTTGSSIMPHKKNPDVFELIRAKCNRIQSTPNELTLLINNLPSGYHRDLQLTKEIIFPAIQNLKDCLKMTALMLEQIQISSNLLKQEKYQYLFSVEEVNKKVLQGMSFREAYIQVGQEIEFGDFSYSGEINHTHEGSIGNLCLGQIQESFIHLYHKIVN